MHRFAKYEKLGEEVEFCYNEKDGKNERESMLALKVLDVKKCMNALLASEIFDAFLLSEATITTRMTYTLDGHLTKDYLTEEELAEAGLLGERCVSYGYVRKLCFDMIKGKRKPAAFHFTFLCPKKLMEQMIDTQKVNVRPSDVANLTLNLRYVGEELHVTAGCTMAGFSLDRSMEEAWNTWVKMFFAEHEIAVENAV